ncbi:MAG: NAD(P)-dependent oxidoreductase [Acidimicrobiales bacterium]
MSSSPHDPLAITVIGIGTMGGAFVHRLLGAGFPVTVWSRNESDTAPFVALGATAHANSHDAVAQADVVLTMLPNPDITRDVMLDQGVLSAMAPSSTWLQMATIGSVATEQLVGAAATTRPDVTFVDAPVSGSREPAESGQLVILASGPESAHQLLTPVFAALGKSTIWLGPAGVGSQMKLVLNTWLAFQIECAAESLALLDHFHVDTGRLVEILSESPLVSPYALSKVKKMIAADYSPDFSLGLATKDLTLVESDAGDGPVPIAAAIAARWRDLIADGAGDRDVAAARQGLD